MAYLANLCSRMHVSVEIGGRGRRGKQIDVLAKDVLSTFDTGGDGELMKDLNKEIQVGLDKSVRSCLHRFIPCEHVWTYLHTATACTKTSTPCVFLCFWCHLSNVTFQLCVPCDYISALP